MKNIVIGTVNGNNVLYVPATNCIHIIGTEVSAYNIHSKEEAIEVAKKNFKNFII